MNKLLRAGALAIVALLSIGANGNWNTHVVETDRAHVIGNPDAKVTLTEFVSYTCPHCAAFAVEGEAPLQLVYIGPGKLKVEVRSVIRNVVDLGATMLVECGPKEKFLQNHTMFMRRQGTWLAKVQQSTPAQRAVWMRGDAAGLRSMASALGFYEMMEGRGYSRIEVDTCLADAAMAKKVVENSQADAVEFGVKYTPSFAVDGKLLDDAHDWKSLQQAFGTRF